ncbi:hypothetical protein Tdes44962_MAKER07799 [Teratosphaeria destructans]|uniref:Uncharacterized protein n=1 Tax=Teratosphaeria destructans TaxID=418781 RepID=A0A9W7SY07_9PEZI|nr:hypothetical protein Tdes44962_MAKER07799 [Teratosphaeria destructans]
MGILGQSNGRHNKRLGGHYNGSQIQRFKPVHFTYAFLALCASTALAATLQAKHSTYSTLSKRSAFVRPHTHARYSGVSKRSAFADAYAYAQEPEDDVPVPDKQKDESGKKPGKKPGKKGSSDSACPAWELYHYDDGQCEGPEDGFSGGVETGCVPYEPPAQGQLDGIVFVDAGVWVLHIFTSDDCTTGKDAEEAFIPKPGAVDGECYVGGGDSKSTKSIKIVLKDGAKCAPGE